MSIHQALCNDCLRAPSFPDGPSLYRAHVGETPCVCGSVELCACDSCIASLRQLQAGVRGEGVTGMKRGAFIESWSAEDGAQMREAVMEGTNNNAQNFEFEFRVVGDPDRVWYPSAHIMRPEEDAKKLVERLNAEDRKIVYRAVPFKS